MPVNNHMISFKYTHAQNILIRKSELVVSVLLIIYVERQVCVWTKHLILRGMLNMGLKIILQRWLTVVGVCVIVSDANVCTADPQGWVRRVLYRVTEYRWLQT